MSAIPAVPAPRSQRPMVLHSPQPSNPYSWAFFSGQLGEELLRPEVRQAGVMRRLEVVERLDWPVPRLQVAKQHELVVRQFWAGFRRQVVSLLAPLVLPVSKMGRPEALAQLVLPEGLGARAQCRYCRTSPDNATQGEADVSPSPITPSTTTVADKDSHGSIPFRFTSA